MNRQDKDKTWKQVRRQAILDAVFRLMSSKSPESLTMDHVAEEAGITKATIYNYFKDKEELLSTAREESSASLRRIVKEILASELTPEVKLKYITSRILSG